MTTHIAYYVTFSGERFEYRRLRKTQAVWRYHWLSRNSGRLNLKEWGWRVSEETERAVQRVIERYADHLQTGVA